MILFLLEKLVYVLDMLLSVENLAVSRGGICLFDGLDFTVLPGQFISLTGSNGVGKTTLLRSIAGLQPMMMVRSLQIWMTLFLLVTLMELKLH